MVMLRLRSRVTSNDRFWIGAQLLLFGWSIAAGIRELRRRRWRPGRNSAAFAAPLALAAVAVAELARRALGRNLSMAPTPVRGGHLVDSGIYGVVRHPMYLSALLGMLAWAIGTGARAAALAVPVSIAFFSAKARHEESLLEHRYEDYDAYRRKVAGRLLPRVPRNTS